MTLDPSRWLVSLAGFVYDWIITREWTKSLLLLTPVFLGLAAFGAVFWGSRRDPRALSMWYLELGNDEISGWENAFTPGTEDDSAKAESDGGITESTSPLTGGAASMDGNDGESADKAAEQSNTIPRFAEVLFRRVQALQHSERSRFIIGAILAQRGAIQQAESMLSEIAPDNGSGYAPAHAVMAELVAMKFRSNPQKYTAPLLRHLSEGSRWQRMPLNLLIQGAKLCRDLNREADALSFLATAAERNPQANLMLAQYAEEFGNERILKESVTKYESHLVEQLEKDPTDDQSRSLLADFYLRVNRVDQAQQLLFPEQPDFEITDTLRRMQSNFFCIKFMRSIESRDGKSQLNLLFLDQARQLDPNNPKVGECIAMLPRLGVGGVKQELINALQGFLATGTATTTTHAILGEIYLEQNNFPKAEMHLQQAILRDPSNAKCLNNLAYITADMYPDRLSEALEFAQRSVKAAAESKAANPEYFDTLGLILRKMDRYQEAIAAFQTAIQLDRNNLRFHRRIAELYELVGNGDMADVHLAYIKQKQLADETPATQPKQDSSPQVETESPVIELDVTEGDTSESVDEGSVDADKANTPLGAPDATDNDPANAPPDESP